MGRALICFYLLFQPDLAAHEAKLMQKIQLLCVMEVGCPKNYFDLQTEAFRLMPDLDKQHGGENPQQCSHTSYVTEMTE